MTTPRTEPASRARHAVVIGGSVTGCLTAAVLARRFERVTVIEKGDFHDETGPRQSTPQEHHVHLLLLRGKQIIEGIFPGILSALEEGGAQVADLGHDVKWFQGGRWKNRYRSGINAHYCSRRLIDNQLRRCLKSVPQVDILSGTRATRIEFAGDSDQRHVRGVFIDDGTGERTLSCDLLVDASGRGTHLPSWLKEAGFGTVQNSVVKTELGYASRIYRRVPAFAEQWQVLLVLPKAPVQRSMGVISPIEGDRWMVTTGGWFGHFPGKDPDDFLQALANLPVPDIHEVIREAEPLSEVFTFKMPGSRRTHYDRLDHWPEGLLVAGDALSSMNPLYSQGMTIAALEADCIDSRLAALLEGSLSCHQLQGLLCAVVDGAWNMATTEDFRFPETSGERTWRTRFDHWYGAGLGRLSANNRRALETQIGVTNLVVEPGRLYAPAIASRIALNALLPWNTRL
ncbi:FAD-dependent monooxygenase [Pseudomonas alliivorans]|uniref:NAD(P)/FAD-dependent oxidoreductase n=1 Tax=Pseudomonas alliivorans TaxID=2810613 RepID=UPI001AEA1B2E|nr:FAD-dependent monooxygenase [Pseudomonas alliivorans]MBP0940830.1 FAD-dependent monooxygenase [Pseudomonas alliivorans]MEE4878775.1 FAD-dependent monooxygenase [Pseudomonas alliivorans]MEE4929990.1 FAD-dependent monooxygenase [Pseudomonas alliivorans]MEE4935687.1 FAD-dependent monooxygenase [Pseudomonas alliivorans]MEE4940522.1 FAD-dependent monooxygenase [Pseudomonas alliivorans]